MKYDGRRIQSRILRTAAVMLCLTMGTFWLVCNMYARFAAQDAGQGEARAAAFVFDVTDEKQYITLSEITRPGDAESYVFTVSNHKEDRVSEVEESYELVLELRGSLPLVCTLKDETGTKVSLDAKNLTADTSVLTGSGTGNFSAAVKTGSTYTLTVQWPAGENHVKYSRAGLSDLILNVTARQKD